MSTTSASDGPLVALGSTTDTEHPDVVQMAGYRLVRGPDGALCGARAADT